MKNGEWKLKEVTHIMLKEDIAYMRNQCVAKRAISCAFHSSEVYNHAEELLAAYRIAMSDAFQELIDWFVRQLDLENSLTKIDIISSERLKRYLNEYSVRPASITRKNSYFINSVMFLEQNKKDS